MILTRTPFRVSFFGGGTDLPGWVDQYGGSVISTSINKYCHISLRSLPPFFDHKHRFVYSKVESIRSLHETEHPVIREVLLHYQISEGLEIHHDGDLPARSGLGSSSSFTVGLLAAVNAHLGIMKTKTELAKEAIFVEQTLLNEAVGLQDQIATSFGGFNHITFTPDGEFQVNPIFLNDENKEKLQASLLLFYSGKQRVASDIETEKIKNINNLKSQMWRVNDITNEALNVLKKPKLDLGEYAKLLDETWQIKKSLSDKVSGEEINLAYEKALSFGALGGKLLGAGGGGFMLLLVPRKSQAAVIKALEPMLNVPFSFESQGTCIPFFTR